jgi:hypothetical protein
MKEIITQLITLQHILYTAIAILLVYLIYNILDQLVFDRYEESVGVVAGVEAMFGELVVIEHGTGKQYCVGNLYTLDYRIGQTVVFYNHFGGFSGVYMDSGIYK